MSNQDEQWRPLPFPWVDHYEVSTHGRVRNSSTDKILKPWPGFGKNGCHYMKVHLYSRGQRHAYFVHRLVAFCFLEVDHKDRRRDNNMLDNLEVVTGTENLRRRYE